MSSVHARVWRFTVERGIAGAEAVQAVEVGQGTLPVSVAAVVNFNALACMLRATVDQRVRDHEVGLLLSYITGSSGTGPLGVDCPALDSSSGHIRRFVSECTGLGVMTAASEALFDWKPGADGLSSFDVLPAKLLGRYARKGVRPDLLYDLADGPIAGEARGRRREAKQMFPVGTGTAQQRERLVKLAQWSVEHNDHDYFMSWVWLGTGGVYVDIFLPEDSLAAAKLRTDWIQAQGSKAPWRFRVPRPALPQRAAPEPNDPTALLTATARSEATGPAPFTGADVRAAISDSEPVVETAMNRFFEREEQTLGRYSGVPVRGRWIRGDAVGQARHEVLLGVLAERVPNDQRARSSRRALRMSEGLDAFLTGRLLTVVHQATAPRPSWGRIVDELLE
ncbi:hypothetical protein [Nocardiopsis baichengensis]|uniref:hypothetical protein n=1 Tax=Nocardiopsis baichengensis TaxID=280240 RepID=UPI0003781769|nr:hypothetical protein [Nocardiopsis baichengensis]